MPTSNDRIRKLAIGVAAGAVFIIVAGLVLWYIFAGGEGGKPVAAPRDTSFGGSQDNSRAALESDRKVSLTDDQLKAAHLEFAKIGETLEAVAETAATTGVVKANEYEETPVNTLVGGVIRKVYPELGDFIRRGQTVAVVYSDELARTQSQYLSMKAELNEAEKRYKRALSLSDISEESRNELDRTTAKLSAAEAGLAEARSDYERSGKLLKIGAISKREFEQVTTKFETAKADFEEAKNRVERAKRLLDINPARNNELDRFQTKVLNMRADAAAFREKLLVLGLSRTRVNALNSAKQVNALLPIVSPISGTLTERMINRGEVVKANSQIATVTDLSTVWVIGQVYEKELGRLRTGSGASVRTDSYPDQLFRGNITYIDPTLDLKTRTAQVRVVLRNPGQKLKIGMYVDVAFATIGGSEKTTPLVPKSAVQSMGADKVVFLSTKDPNIFVIRPVRLAQEKEGSFPALEGVFVGDRVVTSGSFLLMAEYLKTNPIGN